MNYPGDCTVCLQEGVGWVRGPGWAITGGKRVVSGVFAADDAVRGFVDCYIAGSCGCGSASVDCGTSCGDR